MSVTFSLTDGIRYGWNDTESGVLDLNLANTNAQDLLGWLGLSNSDLAGECELSEIEARARRRLWDVDRNFDPELEPFEDRKPECATLIFNGRPAGYLREKTQMLLELCIYGKKNKYTHVVWG